MLSPAADGAFSVWDQYNISLSAAPNKLGELTTKDGKVFAPFAKAGRTPGLWQHMEVAVRKAENMPGKALIEYVKINGLEVLQNVFVDAAETGGPMVFKNPTGNFAIRDFKILTFANVKPITVTNIDFKHYKTFDWENQKVAEGSTPALTGSMKLLHHDVGQGRVRENFLNQYNITIDVAQKGNYAFLYDYAGNGSMAVDGKMLVEKNRDQQYRGNQNWPTSHLKKERTNCSWNTQKRGGELSWAYLLPVMVFARTRFTPSRHYPRSVYLAKSL